MKKLIVCIGCAGLLLACAKTFTDKTVQVQGQTFAILPFDVKITKNFNVQKTTQAQLNDRAREEAYQYQAATFGYIMGRQKDYVVRFQDVDETNTLLKRNKIGYEQLGDLTKSELSKLLKVDGIMWGKLYRREVMPQLAAKAIDLLTTPRNTLRVGGGTTANSENLSLSLYSKQEQRVIWTYQYEMSAGADSSPGDVAHSLMENAARKFPYRRKK